jgi:predicted DNA-binding ribbon-helix-helix protein
MQRTQIYFEKDTLSELREVAKELNVSVSEFIRRVITREIKKQKQESLSSFLNTMRPLESFENIDIEEYVEGLRGKSRIING